jgi:hypothetical protein
MRIRIASKTVLQCLHIVLKAVATVHIGKSKSTGSISHPDVLSVGKMTEM